MFHQHNYVYYSLLGLSWLFVLWRTLLPWFLVGTWVGQLVSAGSYRNAVDGCFISNLSPSSLVSGFSKNNGSGHLALSNCGYGIGS